MNIFFGTTTAKWNTYRKYYYKIRNYIKEKDCIILYDWLEGADRYYQTDYKTRNIEKIFQEIQNAIDNSDAVVIEYTVPNFSSSHQINYAILKKKPLLIMRLKTDNPRYHDSYIDALKSPTVFIKDYSIKDLNSILDEFIGISKLESGQQRYNIVLGKKHKHYLDWSSKKYFKSRSEIIRSLIDEKIYNDNTYKDYLNIT